VLGDQILPDPLGSELLVELGLDQLAKGLALAGPATRRRSNPGVGSEHLASRAGGQNGGI
jgi:hypothetical protein